MIYAKIRAKFVKSLPNPGLCNLDDISSNGESVFGGLFSTKAS